MQADGGCGFEVNPRSALSSTTGAAGDSGRARAPLWIVVQFLVCSVEYRTTRNPFDRLGFSGNMDDLETQLMSDS